ncbi:MAG: exodeoxyribonuclease VII large subunit [Eubacteriales bacterium]
MNRHIYRVSQVNAFIRSLFLQEPALRRISVEGEVSNCKYHHSGHIYFSLKDEDSQIACVMFYQKRMAGLKFRMKDGDRVVVTGPVEVYQKNGSYQLYADRIEPVGAGVLYERYLALKQKLEQEGLFAQEHKKPIPEHVRYLGIVTSPTGAAVQDIRRNALKRNPYVQLYLYPAQVQGDRAAASIARGIAVLDQIGCDCIIVGRGGGSMEDLWAFNEEPVVRAIYGCETPVISAAGHETDTTLADFAADLRVATPTEAAVRAVEDIHETFRRLREAEYRLTNGMERNLRDAKERLARSEKSFRYLSPEARLREKRQRLEDLEIRLTNGMRHRTERADIHMEETEAALKRGMAQSLEQSKRRWNGLRDRIPRGMQRIADERKHRFEILARQLDGLSPVKKLAQGYAYMTDEKGRNIRSVRQVAAGDRLAVQVADGTIRTEVIGTESPGERCR